MGSFYGEEKRDRKQREREGKQQRWAQGSHCQQGSGRRCGRGQGEGVSRQASGEGAEARSQESEPQRGRPVWLDGAREGQEEVQSGHEILRRTFAKTDGDKG